MLPRRPILALAFGASMTLSCATPMLVSQGDEAYRQKNYALALVNYDAAIEDTTLGAAERERVRQQREDALRAWLNEVGAHALAQVAVGEIDEAVGILLRCSAELEARDWVELARPHWEAEVSAVGDRLISLFEEPKSFAERTFAIRQLGRIESSLPRTHLAHGLLERLRREAALEHLQLSEEAGPFPVMKYLHRRIAHHHRSDVPVGAAAQRAFLATSRFRPMLAQDARICPEAEQAIVAFDQGSGLAVVIGGRIDCGLEATEEKRAHSRYEERSVPNTHCSYEKKTERRGSVTYESSGFTCTEYERRELDRVGYEIVHGIAKGRVEGALELALAPLSPRFVRMDDTISVDEAHGSKATALESGKEQARSFVTRALANALQKLAEDVATELVADGARAEQRGDWVSAEASYASGIALLGAAPGRFGTWFAERYGLSEHEVVSALDLASESLTERRLGASPTLPPPDEEGMRRLSERNARAEEGAFNRSQIGLEALFLSPRADGNQPASAAGLLGFGAHGASKETIGAGGLASCSLGYGTQKNVWYGCDFLLGPNLHLGPVMLTLGVGGGGSGMSKGAEGSHAQPGAWYWASGLITRIVLDRAWELEANGMRTEDAGLGKAAGRIFNPGEPVRESRFGAGLIFRTERGARYYFGGRYIDFGDARAMGVVVGLDAFTAKN